LLRQSVVESHTLAVGGGAMGVLLARSSMKLLLRLAPQSAIVGLEDVLAVRVGYGRTSAFARAEHR